jgi:uncharacterized membrane protein
MKGDLAMLYEWELYSFELTTRVVGMLIGVAVVISVLLVLVGADHDDVEKPVSPLQILAYRRRRGEIDEKEYNRLRDALQH